LRFGSIDSKDGKRSAQGFIIWVIIGVFRLFADINLEMKDVIINPRQRPAKPNEMAALVSLIANLIFKPAPIIAPAIRPATGIK
jgi:hypothetical protein